MACPKSSQHDINRDGILDVAAQCFARRGYSAASISRIAAAGPPSDAAFAGEVIAMPEHGLSQ